MASNQTFQCPSCGAALVAQGAARQVKCPYCGTQVIVPDSLRTPQAPPQQAWPPSVVVVQAPASAPVAQPARSSAGGCLVTLVFVIVVLGIVGFAVFTSLQGFSASPSININVPIEVSTAVSQPFFEATRAPAPTFTPSYAAVALTFGKEGTGPGFFQDARGVGADGDGNIYVSEYTSGRMQRFDKDGNFLNAWKTEGKTPLRGLAVDRAGNVYVVRAGAILKYNRAEGTLVDTFKGDNSTYFDDVAVLSDGSLLAFSYRGSDDLIHLSADGKVLDQFQKVVSGQTDNPETLIRLAVDGQDTIFALASVTTAVFKFAPDGRFVTRFGSQGSDPGQFSGPLAITVDNQSRVYVGEGSRIQVFDPDGRYLDQIEGAGVALGLGFTSQNELLVAARDHVLKMTLNQP